MEALLLAVISLAALFTAVQRRALHALAGTALTAAAVAASIARTDLLLGAAVLLTQALLIPLAATHLRRLEHEGARPFPALAVAAGALLGLALALVPSPSPAIDAVDGNDPTGLAVLVAATGLLIGAAVAVRVTDGRRT